MDQTFVGRQELLQELKHCLDNATAGDGGARVIVGYAGLGKSAVLDHLCRSARETGFLVVRSRSYEAVTLPPLTTIGDVVAGVVNWLVHTSPTAASKIVTEEWMGVALVSPSSAGTVDASRAIRADFVTQQRAVRTLLERVLAEATRHAPVCLAFDDLHRSDELSLQIIGALTTSIDSRRVLLIGTTRPLPPGDYAPLDVFLESMERGSNSGLVDLSPLTVNEATAFIDRIAPGLDAPARGQIVRQSSGHPLVIQWLAQGSSTLRRFVRSRVSALAETERDLVFALALLGLDFPATLLPALLPGTDAGTLIGRLSGLLLVASAGPETYRIFHDTVRTALVDLIPPTAMATLHGRLGHVLSEGDFVPADVRERTIGHHLLHSHGQADILAGVQCTLQAARAAGLRGAWSDALELYRLLEDRAIDLVDQLTRADIENGIGTSMMLKPVSYPEYYQGMPYLERSRRIYLDHGAIDRLTDMSTRVMGYASEPNQAEELLGVVPETHARRGIAEYISAASLFHYHEHRRRLLTSARKRVRGGKLVWLESLIVTELADCAYRDRQMREAHSLCEWVRAHGGSSDTGYLGVRSRMVACAISRRSGQLDQARVHMKEALRMWESVRGVDSNFIETLWWYDRRLSLAAADWDQVTRAPQPEFAYGARPVIDAYYLTGRTAEGDALLERLLPGIGHDAQAWPFISVVCLGIVAVRMMTTGSQKYLDDAKRWMHRLRRFWEGLHREHGVDTAYFLARYLHAIARIGFAAGDPAMVGEANEGLTSIPDDTVDRHHELRGLGLCAWAQGKRSEAARLLLEAHTWAEFYSDIPTIAWNLGDLSILHGELDLPAQSREYAEEALGLGRKHGMTPLENRLTSSPTRTDFIRRLTKREREVLHLIAQGRADKEIAAELRISPHTASNHVRHILEKLECANRAEAAAVAVSTEHGLVR